MSNPKTTIFSFLLLALALIYTFSFHVPSAVTLASPTNFLTATTYHVATSGTDNSSCGSAQTPCHTIQYAVEKAASGDTVKVAAGTYTYSSASDRCNEWYGTTGVVCVDRKHLTILGGYTTNNWHTPNHTVNRTIIDGQQNYRGVFVLQTAVTPTSLHMDGFTIRNGRARSIPARGGNDAIFAFGGGMFVDRANATLRHITFEHNFSMGEVTNSGYGGSGGGGGLAIHTSSSSHLEHILFHNNKALGGIGPDRGGLGIGGGLYTFNSTVAGHHLTFTNNQAVGADSNGSGISHGEKADGQGGAIAAQLGSDLTLSHITIINNETRGGNTPNGSSGGGFGGGIFAELANVTVVDALIKNNLAVGGTGKNESHDPFSLGGGIATDASNLTLDRAEIIQNTARGGNSEQLAGSVGGGGIGVQRLGDDSQTIIRNSIIGDNLAAMGNGPDKSRGGGGGGIFLNGAAATISHSTIANNALNESHMQGSGIVVMSFGAATPATAEINYTIIANHTMANALHVQPNHPGTQVTLNKGLFDNNTTNTSNFGNITGLNTMISGPASFVNAAEANFRIQGDSAARDAIGYSTLNEDIDNETRDNSPDIGASEYVLQLPEFTYYGATTIESGKLNLSWQAINMGDVLDRYVLTVTCPAGGSPPAEMGCGSPTNLGMATTYQLSGMTNFQTYTLTIEAYDNVNNLLATATITAVPTDIFIFLPYIER